MVTPIDPELCKRTGRILTEWFEFPELNAEDIERIACERVGVTPEDRPRGYVNSMEPEENELARKINAYISKRKNAKWPGGMSKQETQYRLNEASKMIDPTNFKFLPDEVRERTGLEVNPLWLMECLVRSGTLSPKDQISALKDLAQYTHSKAPSISHNTTTHAKPEDWLLELAKEEYEVLGEQIEMAQPKTPVERGMGKDYEKRMDRRAKEVQALVDYSSSEIEEMEALVNEEWEEPEQDE